MMEKLEKVRKGLECFVNGTVGPLLDDCKKAGCEYLYQGDCEAEIMADALALINVQQERIVALEAGQTARVMNENEIKSISGYIWKEYKGMHAMTAVLIEHGMERVPFDGDFPTNELNWSLYNKAWRCWSAKPTDEQRKAVKWDE